MVTRVTNEDIIKWEPQIHLLINRLYRTRSMRLEREDVEQDMRITVWKCYNSYRGDKGTKFHTYLYNALCNAIRNVVDLDNKAMRDAGRRELLSEKVCWSLFELCDEWSIDVIMHDARLTKEEKRLVVYMLEGNRKGAVTNSPIERKRLATIKRKLSRHLLG